MSISTSSTLTIFLILSLAILSTEAGRGRLVGGRSEVKNVDSNEEIQELGRFSLEEYKKMITSMEGKEKEKEAIKGLKFEKVVAAEKQVVSGLKYYLKVAVVTEDGKKRVYDSVVVVKPWEKMSKQLVGFAPSKTGAGLMMMVST